VSAIVGGVETAITSSKPTEGDDSGVGSPWKLIGITAVDAADLPTSSGLPDGSDGQFLGHVNGEWAAVDAPAGGGVGSTAVSWTSTVGSAKVGEELTTSRGDAIWESLFDADGVQHGGSLGNGSYGDGHWMLLLVITERATFDRIRIKGMSANGSYNNTLVLYDCVNGFPRHKQQVLAAGSAPVPGRPRPP
jgi:hypothetical protein